MAMHGFMPTAVGPTGISNAVPGRQAVMSFRTVTAEAGKIAKGGWVVLELGTNDVNVSPQSTFAWVTSALVAAVPTDRCVVAVGVHRDVQATYVPAWNAAMRTAVDSRSCGAFVDWSWTVMVARAQHQAPLIAPDGIHLTTRGEQLMATLIARARTTGKDVS